MSDRTVSLWHNVKRPQFIETICFLLFCFYLGGGGGARLVTFNGPKQKISSSSFLPSFFFHRFDVVFFRHDFNGRRFDCE